MAKDKCNGVVMRCLPKNLSGIQTCGSASAGCDFDFFKSLAQSGCDVIGFRSNKKSPVTAKATERCLECFGKDFNAN